MSIIRDIKIKDLQNFINSDEYNKFKSRPISYHRAISYINNKRADNNDIAISMLFKDNKLIAYRCLYSDYFFLKNKKHKFSWISGSWVHPNYRRQGYSMELLEHCKKNNNNLMFSNYAPASKELYTKSSFFSEIASLKGQRFYFRFAFADLLPPKHLIFRKSKKTLFFIDSLLNFIFDIRFKLYKNTKIIVTYLKQLDAETHNFIDTFNNNSLFKRNSMEINHAINYSWITQKADPDNEDFKYYFSSSAKRFQYKNIKITNEKGNISAYMLLKIRDNSMTIPYVFFYERDLLKIISIIIFHIKLHKIKHLTVYNSLLINELKKRKILLLFSKTIYKKFYATNEIIETFEEQKQIFAGDGDNLYT